MATANARPLDESDVVKRYRRAAVAHVDAFRWHTVTLGEGGMVRVSDRNGTKVMWTGI